MSKLLMSDVNVEIKPAAPAPEKGKGLGREIAEAWAQLPNRWLFAGLLGVWLALFHFLGNSTLGYVETRSLFGWLKYCYGHSEDDEHGFLIPFAVLVLLWWRKDQLLAIKKEPWWPALGLVAFGLLLHVGGYLVQQTRVSVVGFFIGLYGLTGLVWGSSWLAATGFPMILFAFSVPLGTLAETITFPLRMLVTGASVGVSHHVLGIDVFRDGSQIMDAKGRALYDVAPACSGIRSLTTLTALSMIYGFTRFTTTWKRGLMLLVAVPLAVLGNLLRVTTVIVVGEAFGHEIATMIEQKFGFVTFAFAIGCIFLLGWWLDDRSPRAEKPNTVAGGIS